MIVIWVAMVDAGDSSREQGDVEREGKEAGASRSSKGTTYMRMSVDMLYLAIIVQICHVTGKTALPFSVPQFRYSGTDRQLSRSRAGETGLPGPYL